MMMNNNNNIGTNYNGANYFNGFDRDGRLSMGNKEYELYVENGKFEVREVTNDGQKIILCLLCAVAYCFMVPAWTPNIVLISIILSCIYKMACVYEETHEKRKYY